ncbi:MAG: hypothetical protein AB7S65_05980 [Sulfuricurvum sp.]
MSVVGPIGNAIYVNQQMASVASEKNAVLNRFEFQAAVAAAIAHQENTEIEEVRPPEENHNVDPDREHTKEQADQEERKKEKGEKEHPPQSPSSLHLLDIKV